MKESDENISHTVLMEDERITSYIKGKMSKEEESVFIQELKDNPELKAKAIAMARLVKGMKEVTIVKDEETKKAFLSSNEKEIKVVLHDTLKHPKTKILSFKKTVKWLSLAASIALLAWFGYDYYDYERTTRLGDEYAEKFESSLFTRGDGQHSKSEIKLQKLFDKVKSNIDLDNTIHELSLCWEISNMEVYNEYTEYSNEIGWNLAIGYLKNNDKANAKTLLRYLIDKSDNSIIKEKVESILKQL